MIERGEGQQATKLAAKMLDRANTDSEKADTYHHQAYAYAMTGELDKAVADYSEAIRLDPKDARLYHGRAYVYARQGQLDKTIADCTEAIRLDPKLAPPYGNRGEAYVRKGELNKAIADFSELIRLAPTDVNAYLYRGIARGSMGDYDTAIADYTEAIRLDPQNVAAYCNRGDAYEKKGDWDKAIADAAEAIRLNPQLAQAYCNRGTAHLKKGDLDKALADLNEALGIDPTLGEAYYYRAAAFSKKGDNAKAEADSAQAKKLGYRPKQATEPESREHPEITNSIGMKLVPIPAGEFMMGGAEPAEQLVKAFAAYHRKPDFFKDEYPRHRVRITKPFYLGKYEVTVGQFRRFVDAAGYKTEAERDGAGGWGYNPTTGKCEGRNPKYNWRNPGFKQTDDHPVLNVTWNDAVAFCQWLSRKEGKTYRLPTEAEWEYAARAGTETRYSNGDDPAALAKVGNVNDAKGRTTFPHVQELDIPPSGHPRFTVPVGQFPPNRFGLCDMHGNVWEWCSDWYGPDYYARSPVDDPQGPDSGNRRVRRGGGWNSFPLWARAAFAIGTRRRAAA